MGQNPTVEWKPSSSTSVQDKGLFNEFRFGKIAKILEGSDIVRVQWHIPDFLSMWKNIVSLISSPIFKCWHSESYLVIVPFGQSEGWIKIYLCSETLEKPVTCTFCIKKADGTLENVSRSVHRTHENCFAPDQDKFLKWDELLRRQAMLLPSGKLTVICTIQSIGASAIKAKRFTQDENEVGCLWDTREAKGKTLVSTGTQTRVLPDVHKIDTERERLEAKSMSNLTEHLKHLLLEGRDHDVKFKVKNRLFNAHKNLLRARSPVFAAMFEHSMEENTSGTVSVDDCEPRTFGEFLKFVYTGKADIESSKSAIDLYCVGDKYDFSELKEMCVGYLANSLNTTVICEVIEMARVYNEADLMKSALSFFSTNLEEILKTVEWQRVLQTNAVLANELYRNAVKNLLQKS